MVVNNVMRLKNQYFKKNCYSPEGAVGEGELPFRIAFTFPMFGVDLGTWERGGVGYSPEWGALCRSCPGRRQAHFGGHQAAFACLLPHLFCTNPLVGPF